MEKSISAKVYACENTCALLNVLNDPDSLYVNHYQEVRQAGFTWMYIEIMCCRSWHLNPVKYSFFDFFFFFTGVCFYAGFIDFGLVIAEFCLCFISGEDTNFIDFVASIPPYTCYILNNIEGIVRYWQ